MNNRGHCCKNYLVRGYSCGVKSQSDGCDEFIARIARDTTKNEAGDSLMRLGPKEDYCDGCGCHWCFHEKYKPEANNLGKIVFQYTHCCKNQILNEYFTDHSYETDGCREFVYGTGKSGLICSGCGCHRSFHKREVMKTE